MNNPTTFKGSKIIEEIRAKELEIQKLEDKLSATYYQLQELKKVNAANVTIQWKESIRKCLEIEPVEPSYFLKTPAFVSNCVAWNHGVDITRDIKNKIATTLSIMFNQGEIGRIFHNGKTYYGNSKYFKTDLESVKKEYQEWINDLVP